MKKQPAGMKNAGLSESDTKVFKG